MEFSYFFSEILFIHFQTFARFSCWMSVCFLARHLASLKSHTHTHYTQCCRALRHAHSRTSLWGALTFIILWMSGTYSSYTWYTWIALTIRIAVCNLLTFSSQSGRVVREGGGMRGEAWHFPLALVVPILRHSRHTMATQHTVLYINRCDEQNFGQLWGTFYSSTCLLSFLLFLLLLLLLFPCLSLCVLFVLQFSSIILMQQICRRISCSKKFFHIFFFSVCFFMTFTFASLRHTHTNCVTV